MLLLLLSLNGTNCSLCSASPQPPPPPPPRMGPLEIPYSDARSEYEQLQLTVLNLTSQIDAQRVTINDLRTELSVKQQALEMSDSMLENVSAPVRHVTGDCPTPHAV